MLIGTSYRAEDFHYYDDGLQARGLLITNKIYVKPDNKKEFLKFTDSLKTLERFKDIHTDDLNGLLLFFNNRSDTLEALNKCIEKGYSAYPVVIFEGIECVITNEIIVSVHPSVNRDDFINRLNKVADAKFTIVQEVKPRVYLIRVDELKNPSNILILANLIAKDSFWTKSAMVAWVPLDGFVKAFASVETSATSHLGEMRNFKLTINVFDPDINTRTDLLPQLGQSLVPFPFAGEIWFDSFPPEIIETVSGRKKTITVNYPFRQLQYGNYIFQPIVISYEKNGELFTTQTNLCQYVVRSVIAGTDIDDIQPRTNDGLDLLILQPVGLPKTENPMKIAYWYAKVGSSTIFFGIAAVLLFGSTLSLKNRVVSWLRSDGEGKLWRELRHNMYFSGKNTEVRDYYLSISHTLNLVLTEYFGVSLYSVNLSECNDNFVKLVEELNKVYQQYTVLNPQYLLGLLKIFIRVSNYK